MVPYISALFPKVSSITTQVPNAAENSGGTNSIEFLLRSLNEDTREHEFEAYYQQILPLEKEFISVLPKLIFQCPAFIGFVYKKMPTEVTSPLKTAIEEAMVKFCREKVTAPYQYQILFLTKLVSNSKLREQMEAERYKLYAVYFDNAKETEEALRIVHTAIEVICEPDNKNSSSYVSLAYFLLSKLLKVPYAAYSAKEGNPLFKQEMVHEEVIQYLFQHATADYVVQMKILYISCWSIVNMCSLRPFVDCFGAQVYHTATPIVSTTATTATSVVPVASSKEKAELTSNPHYAAIMASIKRPKGISLAQVDTAVTWWGNQLRQQSANAINSAGAKAGFFGKMLAGNDFYANFLGKDLVSEEQIRVFEASLKKELLKIIGRGYYELKVDHYAYPEGILGQATEEAGIARFCLPAETRMILEDGPLNPGSITINGKPIEEVTLKTQIVDKVAMGIQKTVDAANASTASTSSIASPPMVTLSFNGLRAMDTSASIATTASTSTEKPSNVASTLTSMDCRK